jgi:hypothetical protein
MDQFINRIWEGLKHFWSLRGDGFWSAVIAAGVVGFFTLLLRKTPFFFSKVYHLITNLFGPNFLKRYRNSLEEKTLRIIHSWKPEDLTLMELFVPVNIYEQGQFLNRQYLEEFIQRRFIDQSTPRLLFLGEAGSGKTVAMGFLARKIWDIKRKETLIPVLMSFSDIKEVKSDTQFEDVIIDNLQRYQFGTRNQADQTKSFVIGKLYNGNLILLIDGLDELDKKNRFEAANFFNRFAQKYTKVPFVISSRLAVWKQSPNILPDVKYELVYMANLSPFEIRQFLSQWKFYGNKTSNQLADIINTKPYLKAIVVNPLILTILTFIYSQPKRTLPDNRVKFYWECIDALMEKFDNTKLIDRANQFETTDKITILSHLAYRHITNSKTTDEDISKNTVLEIIADVMRASSRPVEKRELMLTEVVQNSNLLIDIPPDSFMFPHRTFMEYFAANYFHEEKRHMELLSFYEKDKGKWQETLSLYCGINTTPEVSNQILSRLKDDFVSSQEKLMPETFVFKALVESAKINPLLANEILDLGRIYLKKSINIEIIESLSYIAINENWHHHVKAKKILLELLSDELNENDLQQVILALVTIKDSQIRDKIFKYLDKINISEFIKKIGNDAEEYAVRILDNLPEDKLKVVFGNLQGSADFEFLFNLMIRSEREEIKQYAAWSLALTSTQTVFFTFLNYVNFNRLDPKVNEIIDNYYAEYLWPKRVPESIKGQKAVFLISYYCANFIIGQRPKAFICKNEKGIHDWLKYLISSFLHEDGYSFYKYNLFDLPLFATKTGIIRHWKHPSVAYSMILLISTSIYSIFNIIIFSHYSKTNWEATAILTFSYFSLILLVVIIFAYELSGGDNDNFTSRIFDDDIRYYKPLRNIYLYSLFFSMPIMGLYALNPTGKRNWKEEYKPLIYLIYSLTIVMMMCFNLPPSLYKNFCIIISCIFGLYFILISFINPIGYIFSNRNISFIIDEKVTEL